MTLGATYLLNVRKGVRSVVRWYQAAVGVAPKNHAAHNNLGIALRDAGEVEEAIASFRSAIALDPKFALAHHNLGAAGE